VGAGKAEFGHPDVDGVFTGASTNPPWCRATEGAGDYLDAATPDRVAPGDHGTRPAAQEHEP
jgi:hypothetical protein